MWFRFPQGVSQINVQQQLFEPEVKDSEGYDLFRAPDHFAAIILDQPGFAVAYDIPKNAPEDLPKTLEPAVSAEVEALAGQLRQKDFEIDSLNARISELSMERDSLSLELREAKTELANLAAEAEEKAKDDPKPEMPTKEEDKVESKAETSSAAPKSGFSRDKK